MTSRPTLLAGGNPQVAKGHGAAPVQTWLAAVPGWKQPICRRLDALVGETVPGVVKAIKWNPPFYGCEKDSWFLSFHCFERYVKITFFRGAELAPLPDWTSRYPLVRYHHVHEGEELGEQLADWVRQASRLPGERM